jgi:predicted methyltransferase
MIKEGIFVSLLPILPFVRSVIEDHVTEGGIAIDATVGNGHDTLFLAKLVGAQGIVYGFDIQEEALEITRQRLEEAHVIDRVHLIRESHQYMASSLPDTVTRNVQAIMFNLGYRPGGDKSIVTQPASTIAALEGGLQLLAPGGVITVVLYTGHQEGKAESDAVIEWGKHLDQTMYHVLWYQYINQKNSPPTVIAIERKG